MIIEINKDIEKYQESIALGLTVKQLLFSLVSLVTGAIVILSLYKYIGLTLSSYIAVPIVAPIAMGGFYTYNGMSFYEVMGRKIQMAFFNAHLVFVSTESEKEIRKHNQEKALLVKKEEKQLKRERRKNKRKTFKK